MSTFKFNDHRFLNTDSESDESADIWAKSSVRSSSIGSIPWAEDAIKQNEEEWNAIEQMFYGERELPTNKKIREEFLEWIIKFPHLRVVGHSLQNPRIKTADKAEITTIDKIQHKQRNTTDAVNPSPNSSSVHNLFTRTKSNRLECEKVNDFAKSTELSYQIQRCLRITSGPLLSRRVQQNSGQHNLPERFLLTPAINEEVAQIRVTSVRSDSLQPHSKINNQFVSHPEVLIRPIMTARLIKMPPIYNSGNRVHGTTPNLQFSAASRKLTNPKQNLRNVVILPAIQLVRRNDGNLFKTELIGRSISAVNSSTNIIYR